LPIEVDLAGLRFSCRGITLAEIQPLIDGEVPEHSQPHFEGDRISWQLDRGRAVLECQPNDVPQLQFRLEGIGKDRKIAGLGLRFGRMDGVRRYLRNGYQSWDGSFFVDPGTGVGDDPPAKAPTLGFGMTALLPESDEGALVIGFARHDRFQSRLDFHGTADRPSFDVQTLWDNVLHDGEISAEPIILLEDDDVEEALRRWSRTIADESPLAPRVPAKRISGWCSWYNLYAAIDEPIILEHLAAAASFRDRHNAPLDVFQIDDGFTPEMGDWLDVKPQFPRGMKRLLDDVRTAGFTPGLWIAPFLVGNRSRLYAEHPDWVVQSAGGGPLAHMAFYGEFRWHKRSEEYYVLDVTHPDAAAYIRGVFRTWRRDWGVSYFKTDFMNAGMEYGPDAARWHEEGLSRVQVWRRMAELIRTEIDDALWMGCGCPLWASVGYIDAARIGRDIGVQWRGEYSADSLLRDQLTRNHASGILWQADPDCVLLRDRFHELSEDEVRSLLVFAGLSGGVLTTSDKLDEIPSTNAHLFVALLRETRLSCRFRDLGSNQSLIVQSATRPDGSIVTNWFNAGDVALTVTTDDGEMSLPPHASKCVGL